MKIKKAVYGGSFDPLTRGHLWIIERAVCLFDELSIVIGVNVDKEDFLDIGERQKNIQFFLDSISSGNSGEKNCEIQKTDPGIKKDPERSAKSWQIGNSEVDIKIIENKYLAQFALSVNASFLIRGLRSREDFGYEYTMAQVNRQLAPSIETVYLIPPPHLIHLSSSLVRSLVGSDGWEKLLSSYVSEDVLRSIQKKIAQGQSQNF